MLRQKFSYKNDTDKNFLKELTKSQKAKKKYN